MSKGAKKKLVKPKADKVVNVKPVQFMTYKQWKEDCYRKLNL